MWNLSPPGISGLLRGRDSYAAKEDVAFLASLEIDGAGLAFVAVERAAGEAGNFLVVDDGLAVLDHLDFAPDQRDVEGLPHVRSARQLGRGRKESVDAAGMVAG